MKLKSIIFILLSILLNATNTFGQEADIIAKRQPSMLELVPPEYSEVVDISLFNEQIDKHCITNKFKGKSTLDTITDNYLRILISEVSSLQMKKLPTSKGIIKICAYTVNGPAEDSEIAVFDSENNKLELKKFIKQPEAKNFFSIPKGSITKLNELLQMLPFSTIKATINPDNNNIVFKLTASDYVNRDDYNIMKLFLKPELVYTWNGKKFEPVK